MKKSYLFATISIFLWSTLATVGKILLGSFNNVQVMCASSFCAFVFLLIYNIATGNIKELRKFQIKDYILTILISLLGTFFYHILYYAGAARLPASQAFIINYLWPILSVVFACFILKEHLSIKKTIAIVLSFIGVLIVTGDIFAKVNISGILGVVFCVLGAISYGLFTALNKKYYPNQWVMIMLGYFLSFIVTFLITLFKNELFIPDVTQGLGFVWNGVIVMAVANVTWAMALHGENTAKISNLAYITPFLSLVWSKLILNEDIKNSAILGLLVIVAGILIQLKEKKKSTSL